jgi:hypothetical protein
MFGWITKKVEQSASKNAGEALENYTARFEGLSDDEVGELVICANVMWKFLEERQMIDSSIFDLSSLEAEKARSAAFFGLEKLIKMLKAEGRHQEVAGAVVWYMSFRSLDYPEHRTKGKLIWAHCLRGLTHAFRKAQQIESARGDPLAILNDPDSVIFLPNVLIPAPSELPRALCTRIAASLRSDPIGGQVARIELVRPFLAFEN